MDTHTPHPESVLSWTAFSRPVYARTKLWYTLAGIFVIGCIGFGIFAGEWSFLVVLVLAAVFYALMHRHVPQPKTISIYANGYLIDSTFTEWTHCSDFWVLSTPAGNELHIIKRSHALHREGVMQLDHRLEPELVRTILRHYLPERLGQKERVLDTIIRICKL
ncbi:MAG: hypothetical protein Q7R81_04165 [Candidatus Peregrinibacteria bacterium]|nr:hypothetical protein [Candidatus Peregrinibacteria bacterium]